MNKFRYKEIFRSQMDSSVTGMTIVGNEDLTDPSKGLNCFLRLPSKQFSITKFANKQNLLRWTHFVMTYSQIDGLCIYINGERDNSLCTFGVDSGSVPESTGGEFKVGYKWYTGGKMEFYLDDLAIWRSWLSAEEIDSVYNHRIL